MSFPKELVAILQASREGSAVQAEPAEFVREKRQKIVYHICLTIIFHKKIRI